MEGRRARGRERRCIASWTRKPSKGLRSASVCDCSASVHGCSAAIPGDHADINGGDLPLLVADCSAKHSKPSL
eukprot:2834010-Rhodomonas_salina.2